jgi:hypothetical protein
MSEVAPAERVGLPFRTTRRCMTAPSRAPDVLLNAARCDDSASLDAVAWLFLRDDGVAAAGALLGRPELDLGVRWAAVYVYGLGGADPAPLVPMLADTDPSVRLLAAMGLIARGRGEGFAPAVGALTDEDYLLGSHPRATAWRVAAQALVRHTLRADLGPPLDADAPMRVQAQQRWKDWLTATLPSLRFDPATAEWTSL